MSQPHARPFLGALAASLALAVLPQPSPAATPRVHAIVGARIVTAPGQVIEHGTVVMRDGVITAVGAGITVPADARVWEGDSLTVYPGLIDAYVIPAEAPGQAQPSGPPVGRPVDRPPPLSIGLNSSASAFAGGGSLALQRGLDVDHDAAEAWQSLAEGPLEAMADAVGFGDRKVRAHQDVEVQVDVVARAAGTHVMGLDHAWLFERQGWTRTHLAVNARRSASTPHGSVRGALFLYLSRQHGF